MKTILVTAYAVNPYKGSEDGMGWNFIMQIGRYNKAIAITRTNNRSAIDKYKAENRAQQDLFDNVDFIYFDWPYIFRFWKKGPLLSMIYFYGWQFTLAIWLLRKRLQCDIVHNLNFHNNWTPSFLWLLNKPFVWGPVGHHPKIPKHLMGPEYDRREYYRDRILWAIKNIFWMADPFLKITTLRATKILCMNSDHGFLHFKRSKWQLMPSVASEEVGFSSTARPEEFIVLSAGRFVPLKGFDITIRSFAYFYHQLSREQKVGTKLILVGSGPQRSALENIISCEDISHCTEIIDWLPREELKQLYAESHVFLFPSHEGAGMVVAEAMSYGLPVVCLDNSGPGELVHPKSTLKVSSNSYKIAIRSVASRLYELFQSPAYLSAEKQLAIQRFKDSFSWNVRGKQLSALYDSLLPASYPEAYQEVIKS